MSGPNTFQVTTQVAVNAMLMALKSKRVFQHVTSSEYQSQISNENFQQVRVRRPNRALGSRAAIGANPGTAASALALESVLNGYDTIAVDQYCKVHMSFSEIEKARSIPELVQSQAVQSAATAMSRQIDAAIASEVLMFSNVIGGTGNDIAYGDVIDAHARLTDLGVDDASRCALGSPTAIAALRKSGIVVPNFDAVSRLIETPAMTQISNHPVYEGTRLPQLVCGTRTGTILVNGAGQNVNYRNVMENAYMSSTLAIDGVGANATVRRGEKFTIAGVFAYNPEDQKPLPFLRTFTVVADATANGSGEVTLTVTPAIIVPNTNVGGASPDINSQPNTRFATVSAAPGNDVAVTFVGAASAILSPSFVAPKYAIQTLSAPLMPLTPFDSSVATDPETGITLRFTRGADIREGIQIDRLDCIMGVKNMLPWHGAVVFKT